MVRAGLYPTTRFARVSCLIVGMDLLLFALKRTFELFGSSYGQPLKFWINLLGLVSVVLLLSLAYRWLKARMLWRLRNRLIVTYVFIGVIPAILAAHDAILRHPLPLRRTICQLCRHLRIEFSASQPGSNEF